VRRKPCAMCIRQHQRPGTQRLRRHHSWPAQQLLCMHGSAFSRLRLWLRVKRVGHRTARNANPDGSALCGCSGCLPIPTQLSGSIFQIIYGSRRADACRTWGGSLWWRPGAGDRRRGAGGHGLCFVVVMSLLIVLTCCVQLVCEHECSTRSATVCCSCRNRGFRPELTSCRSNDNSVVTASSLSCYCKARSSVHTTDKPAAAGRCGDGYCVASRPLEQQIRCGNSTAGQKQAEALHPCDLPVTALQRNPGPGHPRRTEAAYSMRGSRPEVALVTGSGGNQISYC
jgi:hypothetical protein